MVNEPVVITGVGVLASNGLGRRAFWDALKDGVSGIRRVARFDPSAFPCQIAGELWDFDPADFMRKRQVRHWYRHVHQAIASSRLALEDAELWRAGYDPERLATAIGTSIGSPNEVWQEQNKAFEAHGYRRINRFGSSAFSGHAATVNVSVDYGFRGPATTISSGCNTGLDTLSWGVRQIRSGEVDAALIGATESPIFPLSFAAACSLGVLSTRNDAPTRAMRPFDRDRDGIVLAEGAVALVLERLDKARARGARIFAEVASYASSTEAVNPLLLDREGTALARAIEQAIKLAGMTPADIDYVQCHGVSLEMYDVCETNAYKKALGKWAYRIPISSVKSMTGQAYAVAGLFGVAACLFSMSEGIIPPTLNLDNAAPDCDLDYVPNKLRYNDVRTALAVAMSFGGTHGAVVLRKTD